MRKLIPAAPMVEPRIEAINAASGFKIPIYPAVRIPSDQAKAEPIIHCCKREFKAETSYTSPN